MNHWSLIWANLTRRRARFIFTLLSVIFAFALFGVLLALRQAFNAGPRFERVARLLTFNAVSLTVQLPLADARQIGALPGVRAVDAQAWFGGYFRESSNAIYALAVQARPYLQVYPRLQLPPGARRAWLADRRGVLIGTASRQTLRVADRRADSLALEHLAQPRRDEHLAGDRRGDREQPRRQAE